MCSKSAAERVYWILVILVISTLCGVVESEAFNAPRAPRRPEAHSMAERPHLYAARPAPASPSRARSTLGVLTNVIAPSIFIAFKTTLLAIVSKGILYHQLSSVRVGVWGLGWGSVRVWVGFGWEHYTHFSPQRGRPSVYIARTRLKSAHLSASGLGDPPSAAREGRRHEWRVLFAQNLSPHLSI